MRNEKIAKLRETFENTRIAYMNGLATYDDMKAAAQACIDEMNIVGSEIAKKYGKKFRPVSLIAFMR
jgi:hypothetical protein